MAAHFSWYLSGGSSNADPAQSLGGPRSTTTLAPQTLFPDVSTSEAGQGSVKHRGVYVINDGDKAVQDCFLWVSPTSTTEDNTLSIAIADEGFNSIMEVIATEIQAPVGPLFSGGDSKGYGIFLDLFNPSAFIGVWLRRYITADAGSFQNVTFSLKLEGISV